MALTQEQASKYLDSELHPFLTTEEVATIAGIKPATLSQWVKRGYVELRGSIRPGTGRAMLFSFSGLIEVLAFTQLSRLGLPLQGSARGLSAKVMLCVGRRLMEYSGAFEDLSDSKLGEFERFVSAWYDEARDEVLSSISSIPAPLSFNTIPHTSWIVIDCYALLDVALSGLDNLKRLL
ncbi:MAG: helix-turn-helix domain-containing protein [Humidesulfovibrio sp.]|uniref:helix-turn-helix domain-containing protein n=1 Tax=Humidesulfovibrio sp. TaxID=2910988 RepID=UPI0027FCE1BA|nr:helix-turn-helix domain-containing protein [Humidesulfovibrio sp.]MDQ7835789.1 helix-turn-helix domain-containing protein [Humidesulfovibrio sp.]